MLSWEDHITWYLQNGFYLFRIVPLGKNTLLNHHWADTDDHTAEPSLTFDESIEWIHKSGNIAIRLDNRVAFDLDARPYPISSNVDYYRRFNTIVNFSPRGFHVIFDRSTIEDDRELKPIFESNFNIKMNLKRGDRVRTGHSFIIVPPSRVLQNSQLKSYFFLDDQRVIKGELKIAGLKRPYTKAEQYQADGEFAYDIIHNHNRLF